MKAASTNSTVRWVFLIALSLRAFHLFCVQASPCGTFLIGDAARYDAWAHEIVDGHWLGNEVFYQAPLYPYFLAVVYATLGSNLFIVRLIQAILGAWSCMLLTVGTTNLFNRRAGLIAGLMLACYAPAIFMEGLLQKSSLDLFFVSLTIWIFSRTMMVNRTAHWVAIGVSTAALCLTRENALLAIPVIALWILLAGRSKKGATADHDQCPALARCNRWARARFLAAFAAGLLLVLFPVAARNAYVGGQWHVTTSQFGPNFFIGNNSESNGTYIPLVTGRGDAKYEARDAKRLAEDATGRTLSAGEVSQFYVQRALGYIQRQPVAWLGLMARKAGLAVNRFESIDTEDQYTWSHWSPVLQVTGGLFHFGVLLALSLVGIWSTRRHWHRLWWAYGLIAVMFGTLLVFYVFSRYRLPLVPLLAVFAGAGIDELLRIVIARPLASGKLWKMVAVAFSVLAASYLPMVDRTTGEAVTLSNFGAMLATR